MNIFHLSTDIKTCAQYHCDKHVVKMILETAQLLSGVHWFNDSPAPYKKTHINHPCSKWARESISNYIWLCSLGKELCKEYTYRYGKVHKSEAVIDWCLVNKPNLQEIGLTPFAQAMPDEFKSQDSVTAYRKYYLGAKKHILNYTKRSQPEWITSDA